jgi:hypothetical protein
MVWKKVSNSDAGDSTHFGGDDVDKISKTFNAETQTDPINIKDENLLIVDPTDTSKKVRFDAVGITTSTTRVLTIPDADVTLASTVAATTSVAGLMSSADKTKLDAIEASADVTDATNVNAAGALMLSDTSTAGLGIVIDEDAMGSNSATKVPTQQSVVAYVASQITAEDLDTAGDSGTGAIDLNSQSLTVSGGSGITTSASSQAITIAGDDASATAKGVVELATTAELNTGTDTTRAVTVAGIEASARSVKLDAIEALADVTDATNVNAAGAVMLSDSTTAGMGFVIDEDAMGSDSATKIPTQQSVVAYVASKIASSVTLKGNYDASADSPSLDDGSPIAGIVAGDHYVVSTAGTFFTEVLQAGDSIIAKQDSPTTLSHWITVNNNMVTPIVTANIAADAVDGTKIADNAIDSEHYTDASIDLAHMSVNSIDSDQYVDASIDLAHLAADSVDGSKIVDDAINSEHYTDASIDLAHMSVNSVDSDQYVDGSVDLAHLSADSVDGTKIADDAIDSEHITDGSVDLAHMSVNSVDSDQYVDASIDLAHLAADSVDGTKIADDAIDSEHYTDASIDSAHLSTGLTINDPTLTFSIRADTSTAYVPVLADAGKVVTLNNGSATTCIIPTNSSVAFPVGCSLTWIQIGAGQVTISGISGVTVTSSGGTAASPAITAQHNSATAIKTATNSWTVIGAIE